ncbi:GTPase-activating protein [Xylographa carneopallida]|nr:GTPase-activating protein [Xylographa carneopallida]
MDVTDARLSSAENSDRETDTFEDAHDSVVQVQPIHTRSRSNASARSLTDRSSSLASVRSLTNRQEASTTPMERRPSHVLSERRPSDSISEQTTPRLSKTPSTMQDKTTEDLHGVDVISPKNDALTSERSDGSPLLTARRFSTFDNVYLSEVDEIVELNEHRGRSATTSSNNSERSLSRSSAVSASRPPLNYRLSNLSQSVSSAPGASKTQGSSSMSRKLSSPFAWLSRKKSTVPGSTSPPHASARRHTAATLGSVGSNPEFMLSKLDEERGSDSTIHGAKLPARESLKERFKLVRMKEEAGINLSQSTEHRGSSSSRTASMVGMVDHGEGVGLGIDDRGFTLEEEDIGLTISPPLLPDAEVLAERMSLGCSGSIASSIDPTLAPGTVSGISCGPSAMQDPESPIDWDLWQSVVYEGPAAVAKTSAAELNRAIASGIPSAIRGVVWQVLAQSKNEDLEGVYRELILRGTDKEPQNQSPSLPSAPQSANSLKSNGTQKESIASSASSIHSENSTPATTNGLTSPSTSQDADTANAAKLQAAMNAERQQKAKEDLAALKKLEKTIRKDLGARTNYSKYAAAAGLQEALFGVCKAYALFDEGVGYAQGMNFIVMPLLFNMPEEEAFCLLVRLMNRYHLRDMFVQDMPGLHLHLYQFERLLEDTEPALCYHLHKRGIVPSVYATQWFLTLFAYRFPLQLVLRVYDLILSEGLEGAILKFGIALMQKNAESLLSMLDMSTLKVFLNERLFDVYIDQAPSANSILESGFFGNSGGMEKEVYRADLLVQDACAVKVTPELLKAYTSDYETRIRLEKEREAELEALRSANASLALKVRSLEQIAEKSDTDHVQMATEMIRSKMENEELRSTNKELLAEIQELSQTVASQPADVEAKLKDEMERIMSRNIEVQNENRALEEQMADMERNLVETKMKFAQINSDYDILKQKWSDLRKALGD